MDEKKHVGRPTNEEVASRKRKRVVKVSLITLACVLLFGGLFVFLNRDNIDFSSIMGNSASKTYNYKVNSYSSYYKNNKEVVTGFYKLNLNTSKLNKYGYTSCVVNDTKYATCKVYNNKLEVYAKKTGVVSIKIYGKNKNNKTVSTNINVKINSDFRSPICKINKASIAISKGKTLTATVKCNEDVTFTSEGKKYNNTNHFSAKYNSVLYNQNCETDIYYSYIQKVEKINNKSYKLYYYIPENACSSKDFRLVVFQNTFMDSNGNININQFESKKISIK